MDNYSKKIMTGVNRIPLIGITMGDPAGIGAEIAVKALLDPNIGDICRAVIIGDTEVITDAIRFTGLDASIRSVSQISGDAFRPGIINILNLNNVDMERLVYGKVHPSAGRAALEYIEKGIRLALEGSVDAVVTGPIHKEALNQAGHNYSGHTEIFADLTQTEDYAMMLVDQDMKVVHVTTHVSLRRACDLITRDRVRIVIQLAHDAMRDLGIETPRIGVAGLNPHAGEDGLFGDEEIREIIPAITDARDLGIKVDGPVPPDTLFAKARGGQYDVAVAMYHDQGHIPLKTVGFSFDNRSGKWNSVSGVNVTLGLPIIRTSVDHGVAFGKAGKGRANPESLIQAIHMAVNLAKTR